MRKSVIVFGVLVVVLGWLPVSQAQAPEVAMNELRIDQSGTDVDEYFELFGDANASLDGLTYIVIGDGSAGDGVIENVTDLSGQSLDANGFFVAAESSFTLGTADMTTVLGFENSDNVTHMLVRNFTGNDGDDLDTNDDGTLDITPWSEIVDCLALLEEVGGGNSVYCPTTLGPNGFYVPSHAYYCDVVGWEIGDHFDLSYDTPGGVNDCPAFAEPGIPMLDVRGLALLVLVLAAGGVYMLRRR